jgi:hypothetical protein
METTLPSFPNIKAGEIGMELCEAIGAREGDLSDVLSNPILADVIEERFRKIRDMASGTHFYAVYAHYHQYIDHKYHQGYIHAR